MQTLEQFLEEKRFPSTLPLDNQIHRFDRWGKYQTGWFKGRVITVGQKNVIVARCGDWATDEKFEYISETNLTKEELNEFKALKEKADREESEEKKRIQEETAKACEALWESLSINGVVPAYLERKGIAGTTGHLFGCRPLYNSTGGEAHLAVPVRDITGKLWGIQKISPDGEKFFTPGQRIRGCFHLIRGDSEPTDLVYLVEGLATGASVFLATGIPTVVCFNAGNLGPVARSIRERYPRAELIICGDEDLFTERDGIPINPGRKYATKASQDVSRCRVVFPKFASLDGKPTDFNDLHVREGLEAVKLQLEEALTENFTAKTDNTPPPPGDGDGDPKTTYDIALEKFRKQYHYLMLGGSKICLVWNGRFYEEMSDAYIRQFAHENLVVKRGVMKKNREELLDRVFISQLKDPTWFDTTTKRKINFQNGVLDLETMVLTPHSTEVGFRYVLEYPYEAGAASPVFDKMLSDICCGDEGLQRVLLEFMGYALSNDSCWAQKALILDGEGENGKSTFMNVLRSLAGKDNYASLTMSDLRAEGNRQMLDGKLFNMAEETPTRSLMESSIFKNLVSGGETQVRQIYKKPYVMRNRAKLIFACNELPRSNDTTHGYFRRFIIVPFRAVFSHARGNLDPFIENKLIHERPGIFNKAMAAYQEMFKRRKFTDAKKSQEALEAYRSEVDSAKAWIDANVTVHPMDHEPGTLIPMSDLYTAYVDECERAGLEPITAIAFGKKLTLAIPDYEARYIRKKVDGKTLRGLKNISYEMNMIF